MEGLPIDDIIINSQVWNTHNQNICRRKPRSFLYCTIISSKKLSSSLYSATSICARRRHAICRRLDPHTPNSTQPVKVLGGIISTAIPVPGGFVFSSEPASSSGGSDEPLSEEAGDDFPTDKSDPERPLQLELVIVLFFDGDSGFFLFKGADCVAAFLSKASGGGAMAVLGSIVQCACPKTFEFSAFLD